jgi:hypothetical protein
VSKNKIIAAIALTAAFAANAQSNKVYGEVGVTSLTVTELGYTAKPSMVRGLIGQELNENFAIEGMLATGLSDGNFNVSGVNVGIKVDNAYGAYLKAKANPSNDLEVFARVGFNKMNITASALGYSASDSGSDTAIGAGLKFALAKDVKLAVDYMTYYQKNGIKATGYTVGLGFNF